MSGDYTGAALLIALLVGVVIGLLVGIYIDYKTKPLDPFS